MRSSGVLDERDRLAGADHLCWVYDDPGSFMDAALRYLAEGLDRGERVLCIGEGLAEEFRAAGGPFGGIDALVARGALRFKALDAAYLESGGDAAHPPVRPADQRAFYDAAVRQAIADGFRGLRVVAEATPLAMTPAGRAVLVGWEHIADEYIASGSGMTALCAYRRGALDSEAIADIASVHPQVHAPGDVPSFRIWFDSDRVVLGGTVDTFGAARLARVLSASPVHGPSVALDLSQLDLADVAGCRVLARWGQQLAAQGTALDLAGAPRTVQRAWQLLGLGDIAPVTFSGDPR